MPDLRRNIKTWNRTYDWPDGGEEWSASWGSSTSQWFGAIYPRIQRFIPADTLVEIAPGFGRWSRFLIPICRSYYGVDVSERCIHACRKKFAEATHARFHQTDGTSLQPVRDGTCSFVFTFDSLVHAEMDILSAYVIEVLRILTPNGVAFVHHSNWAETTGRVQNTHHRGVDVSASRVRAVIQRSGGTALIQEMINWGCEDAIDCFSVFGRRAGPDNAETVVIENLSFMQEAETIRRCHDPYNRLAGR